MPFFVDIPRNSSIAASSDEAEIEPGGAGHLVTPHLQFPPRSVPPTDDKPNHIWHVKGTLRFVLTRSFFDKIASKNPLRLPVLDVSAAYFYCNDDRLADIIRIYSDLSEAKREALHQSAINIAE